MWTKFRVSFDYKQKKTVETKIGVDRLVIYFLFFSFKMILKGLYFFSIPFSNHNPVASNKMLKQTIDVNPVIIFFLSNFKFNILIGPHGFVSSLNNPYIYLN